MRDLAAPEVLTAPVFTADCPTAPELLTAAAAAAEEPTAPAPLTAPEARLEVTGDLNGPAGTTAGGAPRRPQPTITHQMTADISNFPLQPGSGSGGGQASYGEPVEYVTDWSSVLAYEVRVEVASASEVGDPEYRLGDIAIGAFGKNALNAYAEVALGSGSQKTTAGTACGRDVDFSGEEMVFAFAGEPAITVKLWDKRNVQAAVRGDPLIGEGSLLLPAELRDGRQQTDVVDLARNGKPMGSVQLRYKMVALPHDAPAKAS